LRLVLIVAAVIAAELSVTAAAEGASRPPSADFDGDGHADLAVGVPSDSVAGRDAAGAVNVFYGEAPGLSVRRNQRFTQSSAGVPGTSESGDRFGATLAAGDFDGDGFADLAVGVPGEGTSAGSRAGIVQILHGSRRGLVANGVQTWRQGTPGVKGSEQADDNFASALAAGDFDGNGRADLAIGSPLDSVGERRNAGAVNVLYGGPRGLTAADDDLWTLDVPEGAAANTLFGWALAAGDLSGDGRDELAIGVPGDRVSGRRAAGAVAVLHGRRRGLSAAGELWSQDTRGIKGRATVDDKLGAALAIGDMDRDGIGDLAIGVPLEDVGGVRDAGAVNVLYGSRAGVTARGDQYWTAATPSVEGDPHPLDRFGAALIAGDVSRDAAADLAIGVPGADTGGNRDAGAVNVLYGGRAGLRRRGDQRWTQGSAGVPGRPEAGDLFGSALALGDFDADGALDLVAGAPHDIVAGRVRAGAFNVIAGSGQGLRAKGDGLWTQDTPGVPGAVGAGAFASALAAAGQGDR
jgi:hypothetical protein